MPHRLPHHLPVASSRRPALAITHRGASTRASRRDAEASPNAASLATKARKRDRRPAAARLRWDRLHARGEWCCGWPGSHRWRCGRARHTTASGSRVGCHPSVTHIRVSRLRPAVKLQAGGGCSKRGAREHQCTVLRKRGKQGGFGGRGYEWQRAHRRQDAHAHWITTVHM